MALFSEHGCWNDRTLPGPVRRASYRGIAKPFRPAKPVDPGDYTHNSITTTPDAVPNRSVQLAFAIRHRSSAGGSILLHDDRHQLHQSIYTPTHNQSSLLAMPSPCIFDRCIGKLAYYPSDTVHRPIRHPAFLHVEPAPKKSKPAISLTLANGNRYCELEIEAK